MPCWPIRRSIFTPETPSSTTVTLMGGPGNNITAVCRQYLREFPLPALPPLPRSLAEERALCLAAYTQSTLLDNANSQALKWHPDTRTDAQTAADACLFMHWLALQQPDPAVRDAVATSVLAGLATAGNGDLDSRISNLAPPSAALDFGHLAQTLAAEREHALAQAGKMAADGSVAFTGALGRTHFEKQAIGVTANVALRILDAARLTGDENLLQDGCKALEGMERFNGTVPRGGETWEIPLHTPDIVAAGQATEAYLLGYELTGDHRYLERAINWAWSGVPFIYLSDPVGPEGVGRYATIAVFGATQWHDPLWIGLPVQWCGLTYAYPLWRLAQYDPSGPWKQLAEGITISAMQQQQPANAGNLTGLLPDSFALRTQTRRAPFINPGVILANLAEMEGVSPLYRFAREAQTGAWINAPCGLVGVEGQVARQLVLPCAMCSGRKHIPCLSIACRTLPG